MRSWTVCKWNLSSKPPIGGQLESVSRPCYDLRMESLPQIADSVASALEPFASVSFALVFGSAVSGRLRADSDLDVAVYLHSSGYLEIEGDRQAAEEADIQIALERATGRNVDLLILNRAPATVCAAALLTGQAVVIREPSLYGRYFLAVTSVAIDFQQTVREYREIRDRSRSLSEIDRGRVERILDFLD